MNNKLAENRSIIKTASPVAFGAIGNVLRSALTSFRASKAVSSAGQAGKSIWQAGRGGSRFGGKGFSFLGFGNANARIGAFSKHSAGLSDDFGKLLAEASKNPNKQTQIIQLAKQNGLLITKNERGQFFNTLREKYPHLKSMSQAQLKNTPEYKNGIHQIYLNSINKAVGSSFQNTNNFLTSFNKHIAAVKNTIPDPNERKIFQESVKNVERLIQTKGMHSDEVLKAVTRLSKHNSLESNNLINSLNTLRAGNTNVNGFITGLQQQKVLGLAGQGVAKDILSTMNTLQFVKATHYVSAANLNSIILVIFGSGVGIGGLLGENIKAVKELKEIASRVKEELLKLPVKNDVNGKSWEEHRDRLIKPLSVLDNVDINKYEQTSAQTATKESVEAILIGLDDLNNRFESLSVVFSEIATSTSLKAKYEAGSEGITESVESGVDQIGGIIGKYISSYNKAVELSKNGLSVLNSTAIKIQQNTEKLDLALSSGEVGTELSEQQVTAKEILNGFISSGNYLNESFNCKDIDRLGYKINKTAIAWAAVLGGVIKGLAVLWLGSEAANAVAKLYVDFTEENKKLIANINYILKTLKEFNSFNAKSQEEVQFKEQNNQFILALENNLKFLEENFPKLEKTFNEEDEGHLVVNTDSLNKIKICFKNIENVYEHILSDPWEAAYKKHARTIWQTLLASVGFQAFLTGQDIFDLHSRFKRYAKTGVIMLSSLQIKINQILSKSSKNEIVNKEEDLVE